MYTIWLIDSDTPRFSCVGQMPNESAAIVRAQMALNKCTGYTGVMVLDSNWKQAYVKVSIYQESEK